MTDFTPSTQIDDTEKPSTARRAYVEPTITFSSAYNGPEGKSSIRSSERYPSVGPS